LSIALDATYSVGRELSGVGVYSSEIIFGLAREHSDERFVCCYRPHRFLRSRDVPLPANCTRRILHEYLPIGADLFHGLNQRLPNRRLRRTVTTFHDLFVFTGEYSTRDFRTRFIQQARDAASRSDRIICVSQFTADQVHSILGVERDRLRVVHHGVHMPVEEDDPREKIILHVGAIQARKNISRLISAFESVAPEWRLVLAGAAGFGAEEIQRQIKTSSARSRIEITGYLSRERLQQLYRRASIFAFPSLDEGFGIPVLEAMASGVPVVTSNCSALPEVAGDSALLVDPLDVDALRTALGSLVEDEQLRRKLREKGKLRARQFTWANAVAKTWAVYEELG
jgi:glycosyltransferase involved in cell wall biosynthesis